MILIELTPEQLKLIRRGSGEVSLSEAQAASVRGKLNAAVSGGRPRSLDRCPCGAMTKKRAADKNHKCEATG